MSDRKQTTFLHPGQIQVFQDQARFRTVVAGRRWGKCLAEGSMISMADGTQKPVELVVPGDRVLALNEKTYELAEQSVVAIADNGVKETIEIKTAGRSLICTPNHPLLVNNRWTEAGKIKPGDLVAVPKRLAGRYGHRISESDRRDGDVVWKKVTAVESVGERQTYDLEIEKHHNFIANGLITHNSQLSKVELIQHAGGGPKRRAWYIAPTYSMAKQIMWDEMMDSIPSSWVSHFHITEMWIKLKNGSLIELRGADKPDRMRGVGLTFAVMDEYQDMKTEVWTKVIRPTLTRTRGRALFIGTPKGFNGLYDNYMLGQDGNMPLWSSYQFKTSSSPFIPESELEQARIDLDPKSYLQEFEASFETMSGRVYYAFDRFKHVGRYPFNPKLPIWVGQDFNIDPMSSVVLQPQPNGQIWAVGEIFLRSASTEDVCDELDRQFWKYQKDVIVYPDPAGGNRSSARGESDLDIFRERGFKKQKYRRKHPAVADRVNAVNRRLMNAKGEIGLCIDESCKNLIESLEQTLYKPGSRDVDKSAGIEHMADAIGYPIELEYPLRKVQVMGTSI